MPTRKSVAQDVLEKALSARGRPLEPLAQDAPAPLPYRYSARRSRLEIDVRTIFQQRGNGLQVPDVLTNDIEEERQYAAWLRRTGFNGKNEGTRPEYMVYTALERMGYRSPRSEPIPGMDFDAFGIGSSPVGGIDADIFLYFTNPQTVIRVQGEYFHFKDDPTREADIMERILIESRGFRCVDILGQDTWTRPRTEYVVQLAIQGFEVDESGKFSVIR